VGVAGINGRVGEIDGEPVPVRGNMIDLDYVAKKLAEIEGGVAQVEGRIGAIEREASGMTNGLSRRIVAEALAEFDAV
jgi:hypothetical protein